MALYYAKYRSRRCVMLISREFIESTFFVLEYGYAMEHQNRKMIISCLPVLYELQVNDIPAEFRHLNCLHYDDEKFYEKLEKAIRGKRLIAWSTEIRFWSRVLPIVMMRKSIINRTSLCYSAQEINLQRFRVAQCRKSTLKSGVGPYINTSPASPTSEKCI